MFKVSLVVYICMLMLMHISIACLLYILQCLYLSLLSTMSCLPSCLPLSNHVYYLMFVCIVYHYGCIVILVLLCLTCIVSQLPSLLVHHVCLAYLLYKYFCIWDQGHRIYQSLAEARQSLQDHTHNKPISWKDLILLMN